MKKEIFSACLLLLPLAPALGAGPAAKPFLPEDWTYSVEPTHMDYWGLNRWGVTSFMLPYRITQRLKRRWEHARKDNWTYGSETGGRRGILMRTASSLSEVILFIAPQNQDHVLGHDTRTREMHRDYGTPRFVTRRLSQILPVYLGGGELLDGGDVTYSRAGADFSTLINSTLWEAHNQQTYFEGKKILASDSVNAAQMENLILYRLIRLQTDWKNVDQDCVPYHDGTTPGPAPSKCMTKEGSAEDYTNYLMDLNTGRYGVANAVNYKLKIRDLQRANQFQLLDPMFALALYRYGADYIGHAKNQTYLPMFRVPGTDLRYLPGLRVYLSPFGIEYYQDNYFRFRNTLVNVFWSRGDNEYQRRGGAGLDIDNVPVAGGITAGAYWEMRRQPPVDRILNTAPVARSEYGSLQNVYNYGASLRVPLWSYGKDKDRDILMTLKAGRKNTGWIPGEYIKGSFYMETGFGVRL